MARGSTALVKTRSQAKAKSSTKNKKKKERVPPHPSYEDMVLG